MKNEYIVNNDYLIGKGLNLNDYALDGTLIPAIINVALDTIVVPRICYLDDTIKGEQDIETYLDNNPIKVKAFLDLQYRVIYNLIFQGETAPDDPYVDNLIVFVLGLGKINGMQKGLFHKRG